ncbi:hypothetical protein ACU686_18770 [Yinghuangia aomiensis]
MAQYYAGEPAAGPDYASYGYAPRADAGSGGGDGSPYGGQASYAADPGVADLRLPAVGGLVRAARGVAWSRTRDAAGTWRAVPTCAWDDVDASAEPLPIPAPSPRPAAESPPRQEKPSLRDLVPIWHPPGLVPGGADRRTGRAARGHRPGRWSGGGGRRVRAATAHRRGWLLACTACGRRGRASRSACSAGIAADVAVLAGRGSRGAACCRGCSAACSRWRRRCSSWCGATGRP